MIRLNKMNTPRQTAALILIVTMLASVSFAQNLDYRRYQLGLRGGYSTLLENSNGRYPLKISKGYVAGYRPSNRWLLTLDVLFFNLINDTSVSSRFTFDQNDAFATEKWKAYRLGFLASRRLFDPSRRLNLSLGLGGGLMDWEIQDPVSGFVKQVKGELNQDTDYSASELFLSAGSSFEFSLSSSLVLYWNLQADYLSGAGAEFSEPFRSNRGRLVSSSLLTLAFSFGKKTMKWPSDPSWAASSEADLPPSLRDSDGDGIPDVRDKCPNSPFGAGVNHLGCARDSDGDGVADGLDDCPNTNRKSAGMVDVHGCPVDSDFDGVADYLDNCPFNRIGARVDSDGCPMDFDADGVPDGLDDCPNTLVGVKVDPNGCIDLAMLSETMVLNIDYSSGSFEIDFTTRDKLVRLSRLLSFVEDIKLEISGFTDNIGTVPANRSMSEKRANRVRDYLVIQGIATERMKVFGRGEVNFVASNQTAEGRARNRRVEIKFYH